MKCRAIDLGLIPYEEACTFQKKIREEIDLKAAYDTIILCEHPPIITLGRLAKKENIFVDDLYLKKQGIGVYYSDRGGDVTFHAPGQLIIYPIFDLKRHVKDIHVFLKNLEKVIINSLKICGISANNKEGFRGVWIGENKIASIGIGIKNWITYHGVALNINNDMHFFSYIQPCGLKIKMISLTELLGKKVDMKKIKQLVLNSFELVFSLDINFKDNSFLDSRLGGELLYDTSCAS